MAIDVSAVGEPAGITVRRAPHGVGDDQRQGEQRQDQHDAQVCERPARKFVMAIAAAELAWLAVLVYLVVLLFQ